MRTFTATDRRYFAATLRDVRNTGRLRAYGRLNNFGRSILTTTDVRILLPFWTLAAPMNIHPRAKA